MTVECACAALEAAGQGPSRAEAGSGQRLEEAYQGLERGRRDLQETTASIRRGVNEVGSAPPRGFRLLEVV